MNPIDNYTVLMIIMIEIIFVFVPVMYSINSIDQVIVDSLVIVLSFLGIFTYCFKVCLEMKNRKNQSAAMVKPEDLNSQGELNNISSDHMINDKPFMFTFMQPSNKNKEREKRGGESSSSTLRVEGQRNCRKCNFVKM